MAYSWRTYRSRIARLSQDRPPDDPDLLEAKRDLVAARLEIYAREAVSTANPITDAQRRRVLVILRNGGGHAA